MKVSLELHACCASAAGLVRKAEPTKEQHGVSAVIGGVLMCHQDAGQVALETTSVFVCAALQEKEQKLPGLLFFAYLFFPGSGVPGSPVWILHTFQCLVHNQTVNQL